MYFWCSFWLELCHNLNVLRWWKTWWRRVALLWTSSLGRQGNWRFCGRLSTNTLIPGTCGMSFGKIVLSVSSFFLFVLERYRDVCLWDVWSWLIGQRSHKNCKYSRSPFDCLLRCLSVSKICESWCINMRTWFLRYDAYVFIIYIYTSFWTVGIQQPASMSQLSTYLNPMGLIWFLLKESSGKVCFHPVATSSPANSLSALDTVHRRIPETSLVLWFSLLQLRQLEGRKFSGVRAPKGKAYTSEACYKIPKVAEHLHNPSYLGKEAMVFVPPFNKQLKRA